MLYPNTGIHFSLPGKIERAYLQDDHALGLALTNGMTLYSWDLLHWHISSTPCPCGTRAICIEGGTLCHSGSEIYLYQEDARDRLSLPYARASDGRLSSAPQCARLRIWVRQCRYRAIERRYVVSARFYVHPLEWPNIEVRDTDNPAMAVDASAYELDMLIDVGREDSLRMNLLGVRAEYDARLAQLRVGSQFVALSPRDGRIRLRCFRDDFAMEILVDGQLLRVCSVTCDARVEWMTDGCSAVLVDVKIYGLRSPGYRQALTDRINLMPREEMPCYDNGIFRIFAHRVEDLAYGEPAAYVPDRNTIFSPTRVVEEFDWRHTPWGDMTRVIHRGDCWKAASALSRFPDLHTGLPTFDAAYRVALDVLHNATDARYSLPGEREMWSAGAFQGEGLGFGVWRRDSAQIILKCAALYEPFVTANTLRYIFAHGFDNGVDGIPMPVMALGDYCAASGDWALAAALWPNVVDCLERADGLYDKGRRLYRAPRSSSNDAFDEPEVGGYALSTQIYFMAAYEAAAMLARRLGRDEETTYRWLDRAETLRKSIRVLYWNPRYGYYTSGPRGSDSYEKGDWETCGEECVLWDKFSIASQTQRASILRRLRQTALTPYGITLMPYRKDKNHFTRAAWPVYYTGFSQAAARAGDYDLLFALIAQQVRNAVMNKTFYEVLDTDSGLTWRWPSQTWHAAGFISMFLYGVLGAFYTEEGLFFEPGVPRPFCDIRLTGLRYANALVDIRAHGWGRVSHIHVNGRPARGLPPDAHGHVDVDLYLENGR